MPQEALIRTDEEVLDPLVAGIRGREASVELGDAVVILQGEREVPQHGGSPAEFMSRSAIGSKASCSVR